VTLYVVVVHLSIGSKRCDKPKIATKVLETIKSNGGLFVRRVKAPYGVGRFPWEEIPGMRPHEKICQALREDAPELRRQMWASIGSSVPDKENQDTHGAHRYNV